jgi:hypothetical protein
MRLGSRPLYTYVVYDYLLSIHYYACYDYNYNQLCVAVVVIHPANHPRDPKTQKRQLLYFISFSFVGARLFECIPAGKYLLEYPPRTNTRHLNTLHEILSMYDCEMETTLLSHPQATVHEQAIRCRDFRLIDTVTPLAVLMPLTPCGLIPIVWRLDCTA